MTSTLLHSQKKIPDHIVEILRHVSEASAKLESGAFVIGATARDLIFEYVYKADIVRKTVDIDFGIAVGSWDEYEELKAVLISSGKFRDDKGQEQRIWWIGEAGEMRVDLVPYGGLESHDGEIRFPPKGDFVMSTLGFREASENLVTLRLTEDFLVEVVSLAGLVLLKFVAYSDRPAERRRDVQDIWFITQNYLKAGNEDRLYDERSKDTDLLNEEDFDLRFVGARLLGRDLAALLNTETSTIVEKILREESESGMLQRVADIVSSDRLHDDEGYEEILKTFRELQRGIAEGKGKLQQPAS